MLKLQVTIFSLVAIGFFLKRRGAVSDQGQKDMTDLVLNLILPCNIFAGFLNGTSREALGECAVILMAAIGIQIFCVFYGKLLFGKQEDKKRRCLEYGIICSNGGFLGNPIAEGIYGSVGLMYASIYLIPMRIMMWSEGIAAFSGEKDWKVAAKKVMTNPCILACALGIVMMLTGWTLPAVILNPIQILGRCSTGMSMLVIGMILSRVDLKTVFDSTVIWYTFHRLVVLPLIVFLVCTFLGLNETIRGVSVLMTAMPAGSTTSMLASKYDCAPEFATKMVIFSTLCSVPATMIWCMIL